MKVARLAIVVVVGILVVGGALAYRGQQSAGKAASMKAPAAELIRKADIYQTQGPYLEELFAHAEPIATEASGGLIGPGFTEERYYTALLQAMVDKAKADGKKDVATSLRTFAIGKGYVQVKL